MESVPSLNELSCTVNQVLGDPIFIEQKKKMLETMGFPLEINSGNALEIFINQGQMFALIDFYEKYFGHTLSEGIPKFQEKEYTMFFWLFYKIFNIEISKIYPNNWEKFALLVPVNLFIRPDRNYREFYIKNLNILIYCSITIINSMYGSRIIAQQILSSNQKDIFIEFRTDQNPKLIEKVFNAGNFWADKIPIYGSLYLKPEIWTERYSPNIKVIQNANEVRDGNNRIILPRSNNIPKTISKLVRPRKNNILVNKKK